MLYINNLRMKLKKISFYLIIILIIPLITLSFLNEKYQNINSLEIKLNYKDIRAQHNFIYSPIVKGFNEIYDEILLIDGITKSKELKPKIIEANYSKFLFDIDNKKKIDENKIKKIIQEKIIDIIKTYKFADNALETKCKEYSYFPEICGSYFLKSLEKKLPEFIKPSFSLNEGNGIVLKRYDKINKANIISLSLVVSIIIILLIEIILKKKLIFRKIKKIFN